MKMNARRILVTVVAACFCMTGAFASGNEKGIEYYRAELYDAAKLFFKQQTNQSAEEKAENYFYLGQSYAATQQPDSAAYFYKKSIEASPEYPYGYIGEGMLALGQNQQEQAGDLFKKAIAFAKKDPAIHTAVAEAYIHAKQYDAAEAALDKARKMQKDFSGIYVAEGDMLMAKGDVGGACGKYDNAILFDSKDKVAYLKESRVYKSINTTLALDLLNKLITIDPDYIPAYAELGEIYYRDGFYDKAIDAYQKIISIPGVPLTQRAKYAQLLFFTEKYTESLAEIRNVLEKDPNNLVMKRLQAYNNYKLGYYTLGLEHMAKFMQTAKPEELIAQDYVYYGRFLAKEKQPQQAVESLKKGYEMDTTKHDLLKEIAQAYDNANNFPESVAYNQKYLAINPEATAIEHFDFGKSCYRAAIQMIAPRVGATKEDLANDSIQRNKYIELADEQFRIVGERIPNSYMGDFWRARVAVVVDVIQGQEKRGLAKPLYEQALVKLLETNDNGKRNAEIIEVYTYLGSYYIALDDSKSSKEYWEKILQIDPANAKAKEVLDAFKKAGQ